ncbi:MULTISPECIES: phosphoglycolate phosphatase [Paraburkholderia]|uniref:Phosphoglycolate phosphatase n=1 Tax=Paraburkholderia tropica TaxID=92647 RepID=A0A1A5X5N4_9BURK|nr:MULTISPECIES: phosphoglycolate phosphatase [Paraburkholderia]MBB2982726.1 phosphoglycolate phosphatase [Paraburkholderia tropica]MBB3003780.1 phosphoglycolate phosphatase [Paraburkholderia tropica]MBB6322915.1 phosphoglycolate phosphatase [Paraburkholderia tropica]MDE1143558.1 phosphoglycolate phosphatase [Paraburkholderia tropica]OBR48876.1 phosphoglycolate phosphatase [Paraburkholderia tropica]
MSAPFKAVKFTAPRIEAALIDLDGTMVDTADDFAAGLNGMLAQFDAEETTREEVMGYVGKGSEHLIKSVLAPRFAADDAQARFDEALALYQDEYAKINGRHTHLYPDVEVGLAALRAQGIKLACVTNKPHRFAVELLQQYGLSPYFEVVLGGDSLPKKKPDPLPMLTACERLGVNPASAVAIGDSENDAIAGRAAGMATLTVPYGYNHGQPVQKIESDGIVATLLDAAKAVAAHNDLT